MTRIVMAIDLPRRLDDDIALVAIARGLHDAGIEQTHVLGVHGEGHTLTPLIPEADVIAAPMPQRWWNRRRVVDHVAGELSKRPHDLLLWSGNDAAVLAREVAARLEIPLVGDVWRQDQVIAAKRSPLVDAWIARSERLEFQLRNQVQAATVVTARPPLGLSIPPRLPDRRPSIVVLDLGRSQRDAAPLLDALAQLLDGRPDVEAFLELRGGSSHKLWKLAPERGLLERVSVLDRVGTMRRLVAEATIVVAPDPGGPARRLIPLAMVGGAAIVAATDACDELLEHNDTAIIVSEATMEHWLTAMRSLIESPAERQRLAREGQQRASTLCRADTAMDSWITAILATMEPPSYPLGNTRPRG